MANHGIIYTRLMNCTEWRKIRERQLHKMPYCEICLSHGVVRQEKTMDVHHVVEVETARTEVEQRALAYAETIYQTDSAGGIVYGANGAPIRLSGNLMTLCPRCHRNLHAEKHSHSRANKKARDNARLSAWIAAQKGE